MIKMNNMGELKMINRKTKGYPKLINIESNCDGSGKQTVATLLEKTLVEQGYSVLHTDFPRYGEYSGSLIERHLKHDALAISNKHFNTALYDGVIIFNDGKEKSTDYFLTKEEYENIKSVEVVIKPGCDIVSTSVYYAVTSCDLIKILPIPLSAERLSMYDLASINAKVNEWLKKELKEVLFKPGSNPSHITRSMTYVIDRDIWYNNALPKLDENCPYDIIISDRSYMSNIIYRTLDLNEEEFFDYLLFTKVGEIKAQQIEKLPIENVYNVLLHHKNFDFNKEVILKRAAGKELDTTERDWDYQEKLFNA